MNMATKKVTLKNEVSNILNNMQEVERPAHLSECPKEYKYQEGSFKCYVDTSVMSLEEVKKMIADNAVKLNRNLRHFHASELNQRSSSFQKALAYIGENRHLLKDRPQVFQQEHSARSFCRTHCCRTGS